MDKKENNTGCYGEFHGIPEITEEDCEKSITYTSTEGVTFTKSVADVTQHIFNHQTHHRGQLTCVLSQCRVDYGCMDLPVIVSEGSGRL